MSVTAATNLEELPTWNKVFLWIGYILPIVSGLSSALNAQN